MQQTPARMAGTCYVRGSLRPKVCPPARLARPAARRRDAAVRYTSAWGRPMALRDVFAARLRAGQLVPRTPRV